MLGNREKLVVISSTSNNEWPPQPQNPIDDQKALMVDTSETRVLMEKPNQEQHQLQQQQQHQQPPPPLKCPRCDSSNTKFCYYNNYSLSQPRHFCKACKRYWTRGGTLRSVPVGGGCRKNKRVKRLASANEATSSSSAQSATSIPSSSTVVPSQMDLSTSASHINPFFYSLLTGNNPHSSELGSLSYPRFSSSGTYDLHQPQISGLGLGFSSGLLAGDVNRNDYRNGFNSSKQVEDVIPSNSAFLSNYNPIFGSSSASSSAIGSLIASSLQRQKFVFGGLKDASATENGFHGFEAYEDLQMVKGVKMDEDQNRLDWGVANGSQNIEQINSSDQSLLWNTTTGVGAWLDPSNMGSSVPSLI